MCVRVCEKYAVADVVRSARDRVSVKKKNEFGRGSSTRKIDQAAGSI